jgi:hypothetical protein
MADSGEISIALTPIQLYAILNGKSISQGELASNSWHEMPGPPRANDLTPFMQPMSAGDIADIRRYLGQTNGGPSAPSSPTPYQTRNDAWTHQSHYSQPNAPDCWIPPAPRGSNSSSTLNRAGAVLEIIGAGAEMTAGVLLILTPEPTMLTKVGGTVLTVHGTDFMQAAVRQLFSGKPVADMTQQGATWAARQAGASGKTAHRIGVVLDVAVGLGDIGAGFVKVVSIRAGRIILSEEAVAGKVGRISLDVEEADKLTGKEGGHTLEKHVKPTRDQIEGRARRSHLPDAVISRFYSKEIAEEALNEAVRIQRSAIQRWAADTSKQVPEGFEVSLGKDVGEGFFKTSGQFKPLRKVNVVFAKAKKGGKTIFVLTFHPME